MVVFSDVLGNLKMVTVLTDLNSKKSDVKSVTATTLKDVHLLELKVRAE